MLPYIVAPLLLALSSAVSVSAITVSSPAINQVGILLQFFGIPSAGTTDPRGAA